jgi:hypothetical protein
VLTAVAGDILYHRANDFTAELFVMGFHRLISSPPDVPFFILETRKRIFASAVTKDKSLSTFLGRAPRIDCDFCDLPTPSDLEDEEVLLEGSRLDAALRDLDGDGWKRPTGVDEPIRPASLIRLRYQQAHLREKILRLSLGNRTKAFSETLSYVMVVIGYTLPNGYAGLCTKSICTRGQMSHHIIATVKASGKRPTRNYAWHF